MGAVPEWNLQNPLEKVTTGTRILEVNGVSGNVHRMYEALRQEGVIELVVESHGPETANRKEPAAEAWHLDCNARDTAKPQELVSECLGAKECDALELVEESDTHMATLHLLQALVMGNSSAVDVGNSSGIGQFYHFASQLL
eukprot:Skav210210  [mRNA]  locus=scaffold61:45533:56779:+ [translate_table: standard]